MAASYEVTDGTRTLGVFSSQAKADALKKELKAQGVKARVRIVHERDAKKRTPKAGKPKTAKEAPKKPVKTKKVPKSIPVPKDTPKAPQKPKETPKTGSPKSTPAPKRADIDYSSCDLGQLADVLYEVQEAHVKNRRWGDNIVMSRDGIHTVLTSTAAPGLCDTFLNCYIAGCPDYWRGWDEETISYRDWKDIEARLDYIKRAALAQQARSAETPKEEPKKGILKRRGRKKTGLDARSDFFKRVGDPLARLGIKTVPVSESEFTLIDPACVCMVGFKSRSGTSFFGLPGKSTSSYGRGDRRELKGIELPKVRGNMASYYDADGNPIAARLTADAGETVSEPRPLSLSLVSRSTLDPVAFKKELARAKKIVGHGSDWVVLYSDGNDLMIRSEADGRGGASKYGIRADVGDRLGEDAEARSTFSMEYMGIIADLLAQSDGPCYMDIDTDYPLVARCTIGDFDVTVMLAPRIETEVR